MSSLCKFAIAAYFAYCRIFSKVRISHIFFRINWHFDDILILSVFLLPISIRFRYLERLVANRVAPSTCPDPVERDGVVGFKPLSTIAYFRRIFGIYAVHIFLLKCRIKRHS